MRIRGVLIDDLLQDLDDFIDLYRQMIVPQDVLAAELSHAFA